MLLFSLMTEEEEDFLFCAEDYKEEEEEILLKASKFKCNSGSNSRAVRKFHHKKIFRKTPLKVVLPALSLPICIK